MADNTTESTGTSFLESAKSRIQGAGSWLYNFVNPTDTLMGKFRNNVVYPAVGNVIDKGINKASGLLGGLDRTAEGGPVDQMLNAFVATNPNAAGLVEIAKKDAPFKNAFFDAMTNNSSFRNGVIGMASSPDGKKNLLRISEKLEDDSIRPLLTKAFRNIADDPNLKFEDFDALTQSVSNYDMSSSAAIERSDQKIITAFKKLGVPEADVKPAIQQQKDDVLKDIFKDDSKMAKFLSEKFSAMGLPKGLSNALIGGLTMIANMFKTIFDPNGEFMGPWAKLGGKVYDKAADKGETLVRSNTPDHAPRPTGPGIVPAGPGTRLDAPSDTPRALERSTLSLPMPTVAVDRAQANNAVILDINAGRIPTSVLMGRAFGQASNDMIISQPQSGLGLQPNALPGFARSGMNPGMQPLSP